ncbi:MAG: rod shape-determining protein MreC, partial [Eubacteriales bacterium]|nr:rod shape-determining protein MreC [Eubacteriales bacterium]
MGNLFKKKGFILILVTVLLVVIMGVASAFDSFSSFISNVVSVPLTPIQKFFSSIGREIDDVISYFKDSKAVKEENEDLRDRVDKLEQENRELRSLQPKVEELREALNLKNLFDDYIIIGSNVIAKDPGNWFNVFKIDIGMREGIDVDCPVLSSGNGLVGRVLEAQHTSSKVITIIDGESVVDGRIANESGATVRIR